MNIGEASDATGVTPKMIRYYEEIGLVPPPRRRDSGYRDYDDADLHRLRFVRRARDLGFTVEQIGELLGLWSDRARASADVKALAQGHVADLRRKLAEIQGMIDTLGTLVAGCHGDDRPDCPIIAELSSSEPPPPPRPRATRRRFGPLA